MKKIALLALACAMLSFSCREDEDPPPSFEPAAETVEAARGEPAEPLRPGFSLRVNANFYVSHGEDAGDGTAWIRWASPQLSLGEPVMIGETVRQMTFHGNPPYHGRNFGLVEVRRETGPPGFAFPSQVAVGRLAAVTDGRATLFSGPRLVDMTGTILSRGTIVVYDPESAVGEFVRVRGFDYGRNVAVQPHAGYVRFDALSGHEADVQSAILLRTALRTPAAQAALRGFLLEAALAEHPDSAFREDIYEALRPAAVEGAEFAPEAIGEAEFFEADEREGEADDSPESEAGDEPLGQGL